MNSLCIIVAYDRKGAILFERAHVEDREGWRLPEAESDTGSSIDAVRRLLQQSGLSECHCTIEFESTFPQREGSRRSCAKVFFVFVRHHWDGMASFNGALRWWVPYDDREAVFREHLYEIGVTLDDDEFVDEANRRARSRRRGSLDDAAARTRPIRLAQAFVEAAAPSVSLATIFWTKPPGNAYLSFYPTSLLPDRVDDKSFASREAGSKFFSEQIGVPGTGHTIGIYGAHEMRLICSGKPPRLWPSSPGKKSVHMELESVQDPLECRAVSAMMKHLDVASLQRRGGIDRTTSTRVCRWLGDLCDEMADDSEALPVFPFPSDQKELFAATFARTSKARSEWRSWRPDFVRQWGSLLIGGA